MKNTVKDRKPKSIHVFDQFFFFLHNTIFNEDVNLNVFKNIVVLYVLRIAVFSIQTILNYLVFTTNFVLKLYIPSCIVFFDD